MKKTVFLVLALCVLGTGCASTRTDVPATAAPGGSTAPTTAAATAVAPSYETFDPTPYQAQPNVEGAQVEHDVPPVLMAGVVPAPPARRANRIVQGYRIQVFSSPDKGAADDVLDQVDRWWRGVREGSQVSDETRRNFPMVVDYNQPYYRVRIGVFIERDEARQALRMVQQRFPEAFIVPDRISVRSR